MPLQHTFTTFPVEEVVAKQEYNAVCQFSVGILGNLFHLFRR